MATRSSIRVKKLSQQMKKVDEFTRENVHLERIASLEEDNFYLKSQKEEQEIAQHTDFFKIESDDEQTSNKKRKKKIIENELKKKQKKETKVLTSRKPLEQLLSGEDPESKYPNFLNTKVKKPDYPSRQFCQVCGFIGKYTCTRCGTRYCKMKCGITHKETRCLKFAD